MAESENNTVVSREAGVDLEKGVGVRLASGVLQLASSTDLYGVTLYSCSAGELVAVAIAGEVDVQVNAVLTRDADVMATTGGRFTPHTGASNLRGGLALETGVAPQSGKYSYARVNLYAQKEIPVA